MEVVYRGIRGVPGCVVIRCAGLVESHLDPRYDLRNHSPDGFEWGYGGSGPAQLALALLADALRRDDMAEWWYEKYKTEVVAGLERDSWEITRLSIIKWVVDHVRRELLGEQGSSALIV